MVVIDATHTFFLMLGAHALADYPLQGDFLSKAKNHRAPIPGVPWYQALGAHSIIQGTFVGALTGSVVLGMFETIVHALTDYLKSDGRISFNVDQAAHIAAKLCWCAMLGWNLP